MNAAEEPTRSINKHVRIELKMDPALLKMMESDKMSSDFT